MAMNYFHHAATEPILSSFNALMSSNAEGAEDELSKLLPEVVKSIASQGSFLNSSAVSLNTYWNISKEEALQKTLEAESKIEKRKYYYADKSIKLAEEDRQLWRDKYKGMEDKYVKLHTKNITQSKITANNEFLAGRLSARVKLAYLDTLKTLPRRIYPFNIGSYVKSTYDVINAMNLDASHASIQGYIAGEEQAYQRTKALFSRYFNIVKKGHDIHDSIQNAYTKLESSIHPHVEQAIDAVYSNKASNEAKKGGRLNNILDGVGSVLSSDTLKGVFSSNATPAQWSGPISISNVNANGV